MNRKQQEWIDWYEMLFVRQRSHILRRNARQWREETGANNRFYHCKKWTFKWFHEKKLDEWHPALVLAIAGKNASTLSFTVVQMCESSSFEGGPIHPTFLFIIAIYINGWIVSEGNWPKRIHQVRTNWICVFYRKTPTGIQAPGWKHQVEKSTFIFLVAVRKSCRPGKINAWCRRHGSRDEDAMCSGWGINIPSCSCLLPSRSSRRPLKNFLSRQDWLWRRRFRSFEVCHCDFSKPGMLFVNDQGRYVSIRVVETAFLEQWGDCSCYNRKSK